MEDSPPFWELHMAKFQNVLGEASGFTCCADRGVELPLLPYLGNGFIATQPNSPWVFMDGFFNGFQTESRRARIPSPLCWSPIVSQADVMPTQMEKCWMHFGMGVFTHSIHSPGSVRLYSSTLVTRHIPGVLVRLVEAEFTPSTMMDNRELVVQLDSLPCYTTPDCDLDIVESSDGRQLMITGTALICEDNDFQVEQSTFYMCTNLVPRQLDQGFRLSASCPRKHFLTAISRVSMEEAKGDFTQAEQILENADELWNLQAEAWLGLWTEGCITIENSSVCDNSSSPSSKCEVCRSDNPSRLALLPTITVAAQYSLLTCLPGPTIAKPFQSRPDCKFYGLCPTGLARGYEEDDYMGHVFWDMDVWMLPWLMVFYPRLCRLAMDYRFFTLPAAGYRAACGSLQGARFAWESAFTGVETCPWKLAADNEVHVVGSISLAVEQWLLTHLEPRKSFSVAGNEEQGCGVTSETKCWWWFRERGRVLLEEVARFWFSRMHYSPEKSAYEILDVMPPDEYTECCRNSCYTNAIARRSLCAPARLSRLCASAEMPDDYLQWEAGGKQLWMPRDQDNQLMLQYEGYRLDDRR